MDAILLNGWAEVNQGTRNIVQENVSNSSIFTNDKDVDEIIRYYSNE